MSDNVFVVDICPVQIKIVPLPKAIVTRYVINKWQDFQEVWCEYSFIHSSSTPIKPKFPLAHQKYQKQYTSCPDIYLVHSSSHRMNHLSVNFAF